jgi:predicted alpha/beta hydrolase family esterase
MKKRIFIFLFLLSASFAIPAASASTLFLEIHFSNTQSGFWGRGDGLSVDRIAQKYTPVSAQSICSVEHQIATYANPQDAVQLAVYGGGALPEAGSLLATSTLAAAQIPSVTTSYAAFGITPCVKLQAGSTYWFVFKRTVPTSSNGYISAYRPSNEYLYTSHWQYNGFDPRGWQENTAREWSLRLSGVVLASREPVIIVPGILGTRLERSSDGKEVWPNIEELKSSASDAYLDDLLLPPSGSTAITAPDVIRSTTTSILGIPYESVYLKNLIAKLTEIGYSEGNDLFVVPYDWRLDLADSVSRLEVVVQEALTRSPSGKVVIVAHSLGGLLTKEYIRSSGNAKAISKLLLVGVPNLGSPKAAKILNYGDSMGFKIGSRDLLNPLEIKKIAERMPSVYELLPSKKYIEDIGAYLADYRSGKGFARMDFDATSSYLKLAGRDASLIERAAAFHQGIDSSTALADAVYVISGCRQSNTIGGIRLYDKNEYRIDIVEGDGTVPLISANAVTDVAGRYYVDASHTGLIRDDNPLKLIETIVSGTAGVSISGASESSSSCANGRKMTLVSSHSPVSLHVYDVENRHTGLTETGEVELGIPGSDVQFIDDNTFVFVPGETKYSVVAEATSAGVATIDSSEYVDTKPIKKSSYVKIPLTSNKTKARLSLDAENSTSTLYVDSEGDGVMDLEIPPAVVVGELITDEVPPVITITSPEQRNYLRSETITLSIEMLDGESSVSTSSIMLDGILISDAASLDLFNLRLGEHVLLVVAYDAAGNLRQVERRFSVVVTSESAQADVVRAREEGWIVSKTGGVDVVSKLNSALTNFNQVRATEELITQCSGQRMTTRAYQLIKEDIQWLSK